MEIADLSIENLIPPPSGKITNEARPKRAAGVYKISIPVLLESFNFPDAEELLTFQNLEYLR